MHILHSPIITTIERVFIYNVYGVKRDLCEKFRGRDPPHIEEGQLEMFGDLFAALCPGDLSQKR